MLESGCVAREISSNIHSALSMLYINFRPKVLLCIMVSLTKEHEKNDPAPNR